MAQELIWYRAISKGITLSGCNTSLHSKRSLLANDSALYVCIYLTQHPHLLEEEEEWSVCLCVLCS